MSKKTKTQFIDQLVTSCLILQGNKIYRGKNKQKDDAKLEDSRNSFISSLIESSGHYAKDQTRWSKSYVGKSSGEIDIFIREKDGTPFTIIEALNLDSIKKDYIKLHLDKIFIYDTSGLEFNFILVYSSVKCFGAFWTKYIKFISMHTYKYQFVSFEEVNDYTYTNIKIGKAKHLRNGKEILLYHLMVDLYD